MGNKNSKGTTSGHKDVPRNWTGSVIFFGDRKVPIEVKETYQSWKHSIVKSKKNTERFKEYYPYSKTDVLGKGTYGDVFKGRDRRSPSTREKMESERVGESARVGSFKKDSDHSNCPMVAIKRIDKKTLRSEGDIAIEGLRKEIAILNMIDHPNVLRFIDYYEDKIHHYLVTEVLYGGELFERICKSKSFTERDAQTLMLTLIDTMAYLYSKGIVHRDIKPENLLLKYREEEQSESKGFHELEVKLADFGYATQLMGNKPLKTICGTPGYMAPEVLSGISTGVGKKYGGKCDVYSLGVVFYVMLSGTLPYDPTEIVSNKVLRYKVCHSAFHYPTKYWKEISSDCVDILKVLFSLSLSLSLSHYLFFFFSLLPNLFPKTLTHTHTHKHV